MGRRQIEIRESPKALKREKGRPAAALLFLTAGMLGILSVFHSFGGVSFSWSMVYPVTMLLCWVAWYTYYGKRIFFYMLIFAAFAVCGTVIVRQRTQLVEQTGYIMTGMMGDTSGEAYSVTLFVQLFMVIILLFAAILEFVIRSHVVLYLITTVLLLLAPVFGVRAGTGSFLLLFLFQISFWIIHTVDAKKHRRKRIEGVFGRQRISGRSSLAAGMMVLAVFAVVAPFVSVYSETFYDAVNYIEGTVQRTRKEWMGRSGDLVTGGVISRGNNYPTGAVHLELEASREPVEPLYLRGFEGGEYTGGKWLGASDEALFADMAERPEWQEQYGTMVDRYDEMYYTLNASMGGTDAPDSVMLVIRHRNGKYDNHYIPYYSQQMPIWSYGDYDYYSYRIHQEGYVYQYYEQSDMQIDWERVMPEQEELRQWYERFAEAYMDEIQTAYTQVPSGQLSRLEKLCSENPLQEPDEITAFILYMLHSNTSYTRTPGWMPFYKDPAEYFLFESRTGYCEHFAATATLMYRLYGVPARYVTGYRVLPSDFEELYNGKYQAKVTDESAHAWVEIFLPDYGWTPVEVTPDAEGNSVAAYPGFDEDIFAQSMEAYERNMEFQELLLGSGSERGSRGSAQGETYGFRMDTGAHADLILVLRACIIYTVLLLPFFLDYRRLKKQKRRERAGSRAVFDAYIEMLHFCGYLPEMDGTEEDFAKRLAGQLPAISCEETERLLEIVSEAAYGSVSPTSEQEELVHRIYRHTAGVAYGQLRWYRKLLFCYWKAFL